MVGGISVPRLIVGTNWFRGFSHFSKAKDNHIKELQTSERIADIIEVFMRAGVDAVMSSPDEMMFKCIQAVQERTGRKIIWIVTPSFQVNPDGSSPDAEKNIDLCKELGATFCMPHQCVTDALVDRLVRKIRHIDYFTRLIRERGMIPGLSTHMPESIIYADGQNADIETYIQIYNAAGFLMPVEIDWIMKIIHQAKRPVMTIKPLAAGRLMPIVGLSYVWRTLREQDMVAIGTTTAEEAREVIDLSLQLIGGQLPGAELQQTRSKKSLTYGEP